MVLPITEYDSTVYDYNTILATDPVVVKYEGGFSKGPGSLVLRNETYHIYSAVIWR